MASFENNINNYVTIYFTLTRRQLRKERKYIYDNNFPEKTHEGFMNELVTSSYKYQQKQQNKLYLHKISFKNNIRLLIHVLLALG